MDPPSNVAVDVRNLVRLSPDLAGRGNPYLHYLLPFLHSVLVLSVKARFPEGDAKIEQAILTARSFLSESSAFREYNLDDDEVVGARNSGDLEASQRAARRLQRVEMAMFLFAATNACLEGKLDQASLREGKINLHPNGHSLNLRSEIPQEMILAEQWDLAHQDQDLFGTSVWSGSRIPPRRKEPYDRLVECLYEMGPNNFLLRFYVGMWDGTFDAWDLAFEVIKIGEADWKKGPAHIAGVIAEIEAGLRPDPLPEAEARAQAAQLLSKPKPAALASEGLAQLIEMATIEYKREISNALPEEMEPLEVLPDLLRNISLILTSSKPADEKEERLQAALRLAAETMSDLNRRLKQSTAELESCRRDGHGRRLFADAFYEKAGERVAELVTSKILWGGLASGTGFILGGGSAEALTVGLQECFQHVITPEVQEALSGPVKPKS